MNDPAKTYQELIDENALLKQKIQELEASQADCRRAEDELRESEKLYRMALESSNDGVAIIQEGKYVYANQKFVDNLGRNKNEIISSDFGKSVHPHDQAAVMEYYNKSVQGLPVANHFEARVVLPGSDVRYADFALVNVTYKGNKALLLYARDITGRKLADIQKVQLENQNQQLQKAESLGRMAGGIAHHFNNQLGVVIGNLEMIINDMPPDAKPVASLNAAMKAAGKAAAMSGLMLTYLGQTRDKRDRLDLSETCRRNLPILRAVIPDKVVLEAELPSSGPTINASANQIQEILLTLITNAMEAVGERTGAIHLNVKAVSRTAIPVAHRFPSVWQPKDDNYACVEVIDAGCGVEDRDIEKLFDPFYSSKLIGRGLGLAVVMGMVRSYDGVITVESKLGQGSTFRVFFPVSAEESLQKQDNTAKTQGFEGGGTVLLIEDEDGMRDLTSDMLTRLGFSVIEATDGVEAVELFRKHRDEIRCVITDLTMHRMNGWETLIALRKLTPNVPVILTSGYDKFKVLAGDHPELPQAFLPKPYNLKGLSDAIGQALISKQK